jgi:preprotein translocase subunit Sss1
MSESVVRAWVGLYTKGLPESAAEERRALIEADLWDEASAAHRLGEASGLGRQRFSRLVRGVPADLTWRLEQQRRITRMPRRTDMRISIGQLVAIGVVAVLQVGMLVSLLSSPSFRAWSEMGPAAVGIGISIVGLVIAIPRPQAGFVIGVAGTLIAVIAMPWLLLFFLPLPIVLGYRLAREPVAGPTTAAGS